MNKKYISESRYRKTTREKANLEKKGVKFKKNNSKKNNNKNIIKILLSIVVVISIIVVIIFFKIRIEEKMKTRNMVEAEDGTLRQINTMSFSIGIVKEETKTPLESKNMYIYELNKYVYPYFLNIKADYSIKYNAVEKIEKVSNKEYILYVNPKITYDLSKNITIYDLKNSIEQLINLKDSTLYQDNIKNINQVEVIDSEKMRIILEKDDPLFIYKLEIPVLPISKYNDKQKIEEDLAPQESGSIYNVYQDEENLIYERSTKASKIYPEKISVKKSNDIDTIVESFKNGEINSFFSTRVNIQGNLGKCEYNIKQYPTGQTVFMMGNPESKIFQIKEVRKALAYLVNRVDIKKEIYKSMATSIDIPYLNYPYKYRFDTIAAENTLQTASFEKIGGIYTKDGIALTFRLLVNKSNDELYQIAKILKRDMGEAGIRIELVEVDNYSYGTFLNSGSYDIALMNVNLNDSVDISFLDRFIYKNEQVNDALNELNNSDVDNIEEKFQNYLKIIQEEVSCIGIIAQTANLVYQKDMTGLDDIYYMNIFNNLQNIYLTKK